MEMNMQDIKQSELLEKCTQALIINNITIIKKYYSNKAAGDMYLIY